MDYPDKEPYSCNDEPVRQITGLNDSRFQGSANQIQSLNQNPSDTSMVICILGFDNEHIVKEQMRTSER